VLDQQAPSQAEFARPIDSCPRACPRHAAGNALIGVALWLGAALASLMLAVVPYDPGEVLCGVWGCLPPLPALVAMHSLWFVALGGTVWAVGRWFPSTLRVFGLVLMLVALGTAATMVAPDLDRWLTGLPEEYQRFWLRRIAYRLATLSDVPIVQAAIVGLLCVTFGKPRAAEASCGSTIIGSPDHDEPRS
jgi:hypothetical protein